MTGAPSTSPARKTISAPRHDSLPPPPPPPNVARPATRKRTLKYLAGPFFSIAARIPAHFKFPIRNVLPERRRPPSGTPSATKKSHVSPRNARRSRDRRNITAVFRRSIDRFLYRDSAFAPLRTGLPLSRETSLVIIDFTIMHCPVASELMHVRRPDWTHIDGHY